MAAALVWLVCSAGVDSVPAQPWIEHEWHLESDTADLLSPVHRRLSCDLGPQFLCKLVKIKENPK